MLVRFFPVLILSSLMFTGCSKVFPQLDKVLPDQRKEYKKSKSLPDLEIPPDLTTDTIDDNMAVPEIDANGSATFSSYQERVARQRGDRQFSSVATDPSGITELPDELLIVVGASAIDSWITLEEFWADNDYFLDLADEELGIIETHWKDSDDNQQRSKFKLYLEATETANVTRIYLNHEGEEFEQGTWVAANRNKTHERSVAKQIQNAFGGVAVVDTAAVSQTADQPVESNQLRTELVNAGDGKLYLAVNKPANQIWQRVGAVIRGVEDIQVRDESATKGTYDIVYTGEREKGLLSKMAFWRGDQELQITLSQAGKNSEIVVLDEDGQWEASETARQILLRIQQDL